MPETTPAIKVRAVRDLGAEVVLHGDSYADAQIRCDALAAASGRVFIHPFDDPLVIAGQGTVAMEILRHHLGSRAAAIFVPVGGGGLIAGIAAYVKAIRPEIAVIGVEPMDADAMAQSLAAGHRVTLDQVGIFADGVAVRTVGAQTFAVAPRGRGRGGARVQRRDLRRHQGRVRRHAVDPRALGRAGRGRRDRWAAGRHAATTRRWWPS